jgi:hypothetical protein
MKFILAAFDMGVKSSLGNYWLHRHPSLSDEDLNAAYHVAWSSGIPEDCGNWPPGIIQGGYCRLNNKYFLVYRFFAAGFDDHQRNHHWRMLCAFVPKNQVLGKRPWELLTSHIFSEISKNPTSWSRIADCLESNFEDLAGPDDVSSPIVVSGEMPQLQGVSLSQAGRLVFLARDDNSFRVTVQGNEQSAAANVVPDNIQTRTLNKTLFSPKSSLISRTMDDDRAKVYTYNASLPPPRPPDGNILADGKKPITNKTQRVPILALIVAFVLGAIVEKIFHILN